MFIEMVGNQRSSIKVAFVGTWLSVKSQHLSNSSVLGIVISPYLLGGMHSSLCRLLFCYPVLNTLSTSK